MENAKGRKYFFESFCNCIIACMDNRGDENKEQVVTAFEKMESIFANYDEISWWNWFGEFVNARAYESLVNEDYADGDSDKDKQDNMYKTLSDASIEEKQLNEVEKNCEIKEFTWKVLYDCWKLEDKTETIYEEKRVRGKQKKLEELIDEIEGTAYKNRIKDIFLYVDKKRQQWRFSAIDGREFYIMLQKMQGCIGGLPFEKKKLYNQYCSTDKWKEKCEKLYDILGNIGNINSEKFDIRYGYYNLVEEVLCSLVPVTYVENKEIKVKIYEKWKQEVDTIHSVIADKRKCIGIDEFKVSGLEILSCIFDNITEDVKNEDERKFYERKYVEYIENETKKFAKKIRQVHYWVEKKDVTDINEIQELYKHINL